MSTEKDIEQFQGLFKEQLGKELTTDQALEKCLALITMMKIVYRPMTDAEFELLQNRRKQTSDL